MDWSDQPATQPAHSPPGSPFAAPETLSPAPASASPDTSGRSHLGGTRRTIATALLAVGLLTAGGVAVVFAADPSTSPAPSGAAAPSADGNGTVPGTGSSRPQRNGAAGHNGADCPNMGTDGTGGGSTSPDGSAAPSTDDPTTAPSPEL